MEMQSLSIRRPDKKDIDKMKQLWMNIFNDSKEYVDLIFDNYPFLTTSLCCFENLNLVSMLIGIPYKFILDYSKNSNKHNFNIKDYIHENNYINAEIEGIYLCGLSTLPAYRGNGIMSDLLNIFITYISSEERYKFLFLIPADKRLRKYYNKFGFFNSSLRNITSFSSKDSLNILLSYISYNKEYTIFDSFESIMKFDFSDLNFNTALKHNSKNKYISIRHSKRDWELIIKEKFMSGSIFLASVSNNTILRLSCIQPDLRIIDFIGNDNIPSILNDLHRTSSDKRFKANFFDLKKSLIHSSVEEYGMVRFLDSAKYLIECISQGFENPKFQNEKGRPQNFQILRNFTECNIFLEKKYNLSDELRNVMQNDVNSDLYKPMNVTPEDKIKLSSEVYFNFMLD